MPCRGSMRLFSAGGDVGGGKGRSQQIAGMGGLRTFLPLVRS